MNGVKNTIDRKQFLSYLKQFQTGRGQIYSPYIGVCFLDEQVYFRRYSTFGFLSSIGAPKVDKAWTWASYNNLLSAVSVIGTDSIEVEQGNGSLVIRGTSDGADSRVHVYCVDEASAGLKAFDMGDASSLVLLPSDFLSKVDLSSLSLAGPVMLTDSSMQVASQSCFITKTLPDTGGAKLNVWPRASLIELLQGKPIKALSLSSTGLWLAVTDSIEVAWSGHAVVSNALQSKYAQPTQVVAELSAARFVDALRSAMVVASSGFANTPAATLHSDGITIKDMLGHVNKFGWPKASGWDKQFTISKVVVDTLISILDQDDATTVEYRTYQHSMPDVVVFSRGKWSIVFRVLYGA